MPRRTALLAVAAALLLAAPAAHAQNLPVVTTPTATTATTPTTPAAPVAPTTPATTPAPSTVTTQTAPGTTTPAPPPATAPIVPTPSIQLVVGSTGTAGAELAPDPPVWVVFVGVILGLSLLVALIALLFRWRAYDPPWLRRARHSCAEASWRLGGTWSEFTDWMRLGR